VSFHGQPTIIVA